MISYQQYNKVLEILSRLDPSKHPEMIEETNEKKSSAICDLFDTQKATIPYEQWMIKPHPYPYNQCWPLSPATQLQPQWWPLSSTTLEVRYPTDNFWTPIAY